MDIHLSSPEPRILRLTLPSNVRYLPLLLTTVQAILYVEGLPQSEIHKMALAIKQAGEGIIRQSYENEPTGKILLQADIEKNRLVFCLIDWGKTMDLREIALRNLPDVHPGSAPSALVYSAFDQVSFYPGEGGQNRMEMIRFWPTHA